MPQQMRSRLLKLKTKTRPLPESRGEKDATAGQGASLTEMTQVSPEPRAWDCESCLHPWLLRPIKLAHKMISMATANLFLKEG